MTKIDRVDVYLCLADVEPRGPSSGWYDTRESVLVRLGDCWAPTPAAPGR